jgi:hypothetical protein
MRKIVLTLSVPDDKAEDFAAVLGTNAYSEHDCSIGKWALVLGAATLNNAFITYSVPPQIVVQESEARRLAETYFSLYPKESPELTLKDNPLMDRVGVWECVTATFQSWLDRLAEKPEKALAMSNWDGKVTKAYFKMLGKPVPSNKKLIVRFVQCGY